MPKGRALIANERGRPDSWATVFMDAAMAPCMIIGVTAALYFLVTSSLSLGMTVLLLFPAIIAGGFAGMLMASAVGLSAVALFVVIGIPIIAFGESLERLDSLLSGDK